VQSWRHVDIFPFQIMIKQNSHTLAHTVKFPHQIKMKKKKTFKTHEQQHTAAAAAATITRGT
jgi:hypothetical protein